MRGLRFLSVAASALLLAGCSAMLGLIYPDQTANTVDLSVTTKDSAITSTNASTIQIFASVYPTGTLYPAETYNSGVSYDPATGVSTCDITFSGLPDGTYYLLTWIDVNANGTWDQGEPYYESSNFTLYGAQVLPMKVTIP